MQDRTKYAVGAAVGLVTAAMLGYALGQQEGRDPLINPNMPVAGATPDCRDIWRTGERLPNNYQGCNNESGTFVRVLRTDCEGVSVVIFNQHGHWYAAPDGRVEATEGFPCKHEPQ